MFIEFLSTLAVSTSNYPSYDNYVMSASALLRLQDTYDLETTRIASGLVTSTAASSPSMSGTCTNTSDALVTCELTLFRDSFEIILAFRFTCNHVRN